MKEAEIQARINQIMALSEPDERVRAIYRFGIHLVYSWSKLDLAENVLEKAKEVQEQISPEERLRIDFSLALVRYYQKQEQSTLAQIYGMIEDIRHSQSKQLQAELLPVVGQVLWSVGDVSMAFECSLQAVRAYEDAGVGKGWLPYAFYMLGTQYLDSGDVDNAEKHFLRGIENWGDANSSEMDVQTSQGRLLIGLANVALQRKELDKAEYYLRQALEYQSRSDEWMGQSRILTDLGKIERQKGNHTRAMELLQQGIDLRLKLPDKNPVITSYTELAILHRDMGEPQKALPYLQKALPLAEAISAKAKLTTIYLTLGTVHRNLGDFETALGYYEQFYKIREEVSGDQINASLKNLQMRHEIEKSQKEAEIERLRHVELKNAYDALEEQNQNILNSINYAQRIQQAILPLDTELASALDGHFVLFRPRDIVSGDFYWLEKHKGKTFIAAVDCTATAYRVHL
jgi:tetratricopeptide (TPR) repeat protein